MRERKPRHDDRPRAGKGGNTRRPRGRTNMGERKFAPVTSESRTRSGDDAPVLVGRHPVLEALRGGRAITRIWIQEGLREGSLREIAALARERHLAFSEVPKAFLDRISEGLPHQGVGAQVAIKPTLSLDDLTELLESSANPLLYILDGIQDPHNFGAILRTADATGAAGVIVPERGASGLTPVVAKSSAGAIEYVPVVRVTNLAQAMDKVKAANIFIYAADPGAEKLYTDVDWTGPCAVVIGGEGRGVRPIIKDRSDGLVRLPMLGQVSSINASNAAAAIGFEIIRQRLQENSVLTRI